MVIPSRPSGAQVGLDEHEGGVPPRPVPHERPQITVCPDGPLLVRGDVEIVGTDGEPVERRRSTVALCRCGRSSIAPYCDGSHKARRRAGGARG